jgi:hypothetical protein
MGSFILTFYWMQLQNSSIQNRSCTYILVLHSADFSDKRILQLLAFIFLTFHSVIFFFNVFSKIIFFVKIV